MTARACLVVSALLFAPAAFADEPTPEAIDAKGKPRDYRPGLSPWYAIWYDDAGWHFHTTTNTADVTAFTGKIDVVGGKMTIDLKDLGGKPGPNKGPAPKKGADPKKGGEKLETKGYNFTFRVDKGVEN